MTRVLVVEDSATQAQRLTLILQRGGFEVDLASDGLLGFERCTAGGFDVVLSDVIMPGIDGYELCRRLKRDPRTLAIPVILLTSLSEPMDIIRGLECGADNFITKPYEAEYLMDRIERLLEQNRLRKDRKLGEGVDLLVMGNRLTITSEKEQMVDLLISTFEEMLRTRKREFDARLRLEALRESQLLLQSALDALTASIAIVDQAGRIAAVNQAWRQFAHADNRTWPGDGVGMEYVEVWQLAFTCAPAVSREILRGLRSVIAGGSDGYTSEYAALLGTDVRWFSLSATAFNGQGPRLLAVEHEDITARKRSEEQLRSSEERFRALAHTASDAIVLTDDQCRIVFFNDAAVRIFGYSGDEMHGKPFSLLINEEAGTDLASLMDRAVRAEQGAGRVIELEGRRREGATFPLELSVGSWMLQGKAYLTCVLRDITQRRQLESQLRHAQKLEAIGQVAGGVAHDFNNVLAAIRSCAELVLGELDHGVVQREELTEILRAAERGTALTRQLLAFSRKQVLRPVICDLNQIVSDFEKMLRRVIGRDVDLVTELSASLGRVKVDPGQIEQVLMNLAVNARDAMPQGGKLTISTGNALLEEAYAETHNGVTPGPYVVLAVSDSGSGMSKEVQARMFEPFFTTKERGKGTGLGLSTVYGIVQQSGGHVFVYSELGRGTCFKIYLPYCEGAVEKPLKSEVKALAPTMGHETILLVEDDPALRRIASRILTRAGYQVLVASNPREALQIGGAHHKVIDLLLTDVVMPEMSGTELADILGQRRKEMKVLFMSGYSGNAAVRHGSIPTGAHFLEKPFGPESLERKVQEVLGSSPTPSTDADSVRAHTAS
jgi:PAS domain S-box-containing protein